MAEVDNLPTEVAEAAIELGTGLPPQVQKSFWKAVGRVFTAGAEWPAKYLEGKARIAAARANVVIATHEAEAAQIKSRQKGREIVDKKSSQVAAQAFSEYELKERALNYHAAHILEEQARREKILIAAADTLQANPPIADSEIEIEDDVIDAILREGSTRSSEELKVLFGRILAGEIKRPGSFSLSSIHILGRLSQDDAKRFESFCNLTTGIIVEDDIASAKILEGNIGPIGENKFQVYGLRYIDVASLIEAGLVRPDMTELDTLPPVLYRNKITFDHAGTRFWLSPGSKVGMPVYDGSIQWQGATLTSSGRQLRKIVSMTVNTDYISRLASWYDSMNLELYMAVRQEGNMLHGIRIVAN